MHGFRSLRVSCGLRNKCSFVGNQVRKLIGTWDILNELLSKFPSDCSDRALIVRHFEVLRMLGRVQNFTKASFLSPDELKDLETQLKYLQTAFFEVFCLQRALQKGLVEYG